MSLLGIPRVPRTIPSTVLVVAWAVFAMVASLATPGHAILIATDSFATEAGGADYTVGGIAGQDPTVGLSGFTGAWSTGTAAFVAANGGFSHPLSTGTPLPGQINGFSSAGTAPRNLSRTISFTPTDGTYYMSVLLNKSAATTTLDLFAGLGTLQGATTAFASIVSTSIGISNGGIGFLHNGAVTTLLSDAQVNVGETYFGLLAINFSTTGTDTVTASVYNSASTLLANQAFGGLNLDGNIGQMIFVTNNFDSTVSLDEWRFGTQLSDVMVLPPAPEPASGCLMLCGMGALAVRKRRRQR